MNSAIAFLFLACAAATSSAQVAQADGPTRSRIVVGPNTLVSRDGDVPHYEMMLAVNPRNPSQLLVGSITMGRAEGGQMNKVYVSNDGGFTWTDFAFPEGIRDASGDPQVAFSGTGTPIFTSLTFNPKGS